MYPSGMDPIPHPQVQEAYGWADAWDDCHVLFCGRETCHPSNRVDVVRDHTLFHLISAGEGTVSYPHLTPRVHRLGPGQGFFFLPGMRGIYRPDPARPWTYRWVGFTGPGVPGLLGRIGVDADHPLVRLTDPGPADELLSRILGALVRRAPADDLRVPGLLRLLLAELAGGTSGPTSGPSPRSPVDAARDFIETHHHRGIGVAEVAAHAGLEASYLLKLFRARTGKNLRDYLIGVRLERARLLLRENVLTVAQVAQSVGFRNYASFEKTFRRHVGASPTEYRESLFFG
jgi:AraC-like DNA-binding protein